MKEVADIADFIVQHGQDGLELDSLLDWAEKFKPEDDISYESTDEGRKEFGKLLSMTRSRFLNQNSYMKNRLSGKSRKHDGRQLPCRIISRRNFSRIIESATGVKLSPDVLRKVEIGEAVNDQTLFKIATARCIVHPGLDRALTVDEMIDILRQDLTIRQMEVMRQPSTTEEPPKTIQRSRPRSRNTSN